MSKLFKLKKFYRALMLVGVIFLLATNFTFAKQINFLKKDKLSRSKYQSVLFGRLKFTTKVENFDPLPTKFRLTMRELSNSKKVVYAIPIKLKSNKIADVEDLRGYEVWFALEAVPGKYEFEKLEYCFRRFEVGKLNTHLSNFELKRRKSYIEKISIGFNKGFVVNVKKEGLIYLGHIQLHISEVELLAGNRVTYQGESSIDVKKVLVDLDILEERKPNIYKEFGDNLSVFNLKESDQI